METEDLKSKKPKECKPADALSDRELLLELHEQTRKIKSYMQWQIYITLILVVLPLLAALFVVPYLFKELSNTYGSMVVH